MRSVLKPTQVHVKACILVLFVPSTLSLLFVVSHISVFKFVQCTHEDARQVVLPFKRKQEIRPACCRTPDLSSRVFEEHLEAVNVICK